MIDRVIRDGRNPIHAHASASIMFAQFSIQERDEFSRSLKALRHRRSFLLEHRAQGLLSSAPGDLALHMVHGHSLSQQPFFRFFHTTIHVPTGKGLWQRGLPGSHPVEPPFLALFRNGAILNVAAVVPTLGIGIVKQRPGLPTWCLLSHPRRGQTAHDLTSVQVGECTMSPLTSVSASRIEQLPGQIRKE
jgi:hypothetical protein